MPIQVLELQPHICDVCRLNDGDLSVKPCGFCKLCSAWICKDDTYKWSRRIKAWYKRRQEPDYAGIPDYDQHAVSSEQLEEITREIKREIQN